MIYNCDPPLVKLGDFLYLRIMNYQLIHDSIIDRAKTRVLPKETYTERHHIIPRSLGGSDDPSNLVALTGKEHFIIHKLLVDLYPDSDEMKRAAWGMALLKDSNGRRYRVSASEYERFRILVAEANSKLMSGEGNPMFNKSVYSVWVENFGREEADRLKKEANEKQSKTMKEKGISPEHMAKIIEGNKNKVITDEFREKIRERVSGENNPMFGRTGELNPMFGRTGELHPSFGIERPEHSKRMSGEGNPMFNRTPYEIWVENFGKEEADKLNDEANKKRSETLMGNKNAKMNRVICMDTNVIYESVKEAAKSVNMAYGTLYTWLTTKPHLNKTSLRYV